jgi:predicted molibdopterin-dependent oxidoreductase YjgC
MECVVVQDIFLNETAKFAHVFLPGSSFLERTAPSPTPSGASRGCAR